MRASGPFRQAIVTSLLSLLLVVGICPARALAEPTPDEAGPYQDQYELTRWYEERQAQYDTNVPYPEGLLEPDAETDGVPAPTDGPAPLGEPAGELPSSYDSRDRGVVSSVKDQGSEGCCWAFALCEAAQAGYLTNNPGAATLPMLDLSEWQLAFFQYNRPVDDLGLTADDLMVVPYAAGSRMYYSVGGNPWMSSIGAANGIGFAYEDVANYDVMESRLSKTNAARLGDEACYPANSYLVENTYLVDQTEQVSVMKRMIMEHGAGTLFFNSYSGSYSFADGYTSYYNSGGDGTGHVVAVVGWDDSYPKENFPDTPEHDGAWLCKNSWGSGWGTMGGYFWMSFDEPSLREKVAVFLDVVDNTEFDHAYYYDGTTSTTMVDGYQYQANVFTAAQDERVKAVSFYTTETGTAYEVSVYTGVTAGDPTSGTCVVEGVTGTVDVPGYHLVRLDEDQCLDLDAGETFSVVVRETCDGQPTSLYLDESFDHGWVSGVSRSEEGQSLASADGSSWDDLSADGGNLRVKAFSSVREDAPAATLSFESGSYSVPRGTTQRLVVLADGQDATASHHLTFASSDCTIARVDGLGTVYACGEGTATITASAGGVTATTTVKVTAAEVMAITKPEGYATRQNPLEVTANEKVGYTLSYTMVDGRGLEPTWSYEDLGPDADTYDYEPLEFRGKGLLMAYRAGLYKVTATYRNASGTSVSQDFYVRVSIDLTECDDAQGMRYVDYDNLQTKVFLYTGDTSEDGYVLTFGEDCYLESGYDYLYVLGSAEELSAQDALDWAAYRSWEHDYWRRFSGDELAGLTLPVTCPHFALVFVSDTATTDHGFEVTSLVPRVAATDITWLEDDYLELKYGTTAAIPEFDLLPVGTTDGVMYDYDEDVISIDDDGTIRAVGVGETTVWVRAEAGDGAPLGYLDYFTVTVTSDDEPYLTFAEEGPITIVRGEHEELELEDGPWSRAATFESSNPVVATVDSSGSLCSYSVGTTTISALYDDEVYDTLTVNVVKEDELPQTGLEVSPYVTGMHEEYAYHFEGAERVVLELDYYSLDDGTTLTILGEGGSVALGPVTDYSYDRQRVTVEGDACTLVLDSTGSVSDDNPVGTQHWGGFRIGSVAPIYRITGIGPIDDFEAAYTDGAPVDALPGRAFSISIPVEPEGVPVYLHASATFSSEATFACPSLVTGDPVLVLRAWAASEGTVTVSDEFGHSQSFHVRFTSPSGLNETVAVTGARVLDDKGGEVVETSLRVGETVSLPLELTPSGANGPISAVCDDARVCSSFVYDANGGRAIHLQGRKPGTTTMRVSSDGTTWTTVVVHVLEGQTPPAEDDAVEILSIDIDQVNKRLVAGETPAFIGELRSGTNYYDLLQVVDETWTDVGDPTKVITRSEGTGVAEPGHTYEYQMVVGLAEGVDPESAYFADNVLVTLDGTTLDGCEVPEATVTVEDGLAYVSWGLRVKVPDPSKVDLSLADVTAPDMVCDGTEKRPKVTVVLDGEVLEEGQDFEVTYTHNVEPGIATIIVTGIGGYEGEARGCFAMLENPFIDVRTPDAEGKNGTAHYEDILWMYYAGISRGWEVPAGLEYRPLANVARCDMAAFLYRMAGEPEFEPSAEDKAYFRDVSDRTPHAKEVWWLASRGISAGWTEKDGSHTFRPYETVKRCDMAAFLMRMATGDPDAESHYEPDPAYASYFSDINARSPHRTAVVWMASQGISKGWDAAGGRHEFRPYNDVARADMAAFLHRLSNNGLV